MCIVQLFDSITLVTCAESPAARDVVVFVDEDRTDRHGTDFKACEGSCDGSFSPGGNLYAALVETYLKFGLKTRDDHILELYATLMEAYIYLKTMSI